MTQSQQMPPDTPLWEFALALWQREKARELCLELQTQGWSVTRLLSAAWLARHGVQYAGAEPDPVTRWRKDVTESIRQTKKSLSKSDSLLVSLRDLLARAELEAERVELYLAWQHLRKMTEAGPDTGDERLTMHNLRQAAPSRAGSTDGNTDVMIRLLAQLALSTPLKAGGHAP